MQSTPLTIAQVEDRLAAFMRLRGQTMRRYFYNIGLFNGHPAMLFHIARQPGVTQTEIAQRMEISKASVAVSVRRPTGDPSVSHPRRRGYGRRLRPGTRLYDGLALRWADR